MGKHKSDDWLFNEWFNKWGEEYLGRIVLCVWDGCYGAIALLDWKRKTADEELFWEISELKNHLDEGCLLEKTPSSGPRTIVWDESCRATLRDAERFMGLFGVKSIKAYRKGEDRPCFEWESEGEPLDLHSRSQ
ncbi:hypothetical protein [uncultured Adlercreutzia sp.]|uniref:hypothetical protein n=1 Tax=uncultured Adlercreutzia sp. TaxID=875803 RepID=UPI0025DBC27B|nr:hypothetical protein [uncultured Adlercreutzia sp.]